MKRVLIVLVAIIAMCGSVQARVHIGAKGGLNLSHLLDGEGADGVKFNYHAGAFLEFDVLPRLSIAPEVMFSAQGAEQKLTDVQVDDIIHQAAKVKLETSYINIPVMIKLYVSDKVSLEVGPQVGFNIKSDIITDIANFESGSERINEVTKKIDFAAAAGLSYYLLPNVFIQGRYTLGLTKTYKDEKFGLELPINARNGVAQLSLGVKF